MKNILSGLYIDPSVSGQNVFEALAKSKERRAASAASSQDKVTKKINFSEIKKKQSRGLRADGHGLKTVFEGTVTEPPAIGRVFEDNYIEPCLFPGVG